MRTLLSLSTLSICSFLIAFLNQLVISKNIGTSAELDLVLYSLSFVNIIQIFSSPIAEAAIPFFFSSKEVDKKAASLYLSKSFNLLLLLFVASFVFLNTFYVDLINYLSKIGFVNDPKGVEEYFIYLSPFLIVQTLSLLLTGALNALEKYKVQALARVIGSSLTFVFLIYFIHSYDEVAVAISAWLSLFLQCLVMAFFIYKAGIRYFPFSGVVTEVKFYKLCIALLGTSVLSSFYSVYEKSILNTFEVGFISAFGYAHKVFMIPVHLFTLVLLGIVWTKLMEQFSKAGEREGVGKMVALASDIFSITMVFSVICFFFSDQIIYLLFYRGQFDENSLRQTSFIFKFMSLTLPFSILYSIQSKTLLSLKRSKILGVSGIVLVLSFFTLTWYAGFSRQLVYVPLSQVFGYLIAVIYNFVMLQALTQSENIVDFLKRNYGVFLYTFMVIVILYILDPSSWYKNITESSKMNILLSTGGIFVLSLSWPGLDLYKKYSNRDLKE